MITTRLNNLVRAHQQARALVGKANQGKALHGPAFRMCHKTRLAVWEEIKRVRFKLAWNLFARYLIGGNNLSLPNRLQVLRAPHRLTNQRRRNVAAHQPLKRIHVMKVRIQPRIEIRRPQHQRNALVVDMGKALMGRQRDRRKGQHLIVTVPVPLPQSRHRNGLTLRVNVVHLPIAPFVKRRHGHDTALLRIHTLPKRAARQPVRACVERLEFGVRSVARAIWPGLNQQRPKTVDQLPTIAGIQHELRHPTRRYVALWPGVEARHPQAFQKPLHQRVIRHIEPPTHNEYHRFLQRVIDEISIAMGVPGAHL